MAKGEGLWGKVARYKREHPDASADECVDSVGVPKSQRQKLKAAAYQALLSKPRSPVTAGQALSQFKATRKQMRRKGKLPGGKSGPFLIGVGVDRGVEVVMGTGGRTLGSIELSPSGIVFVKGNAERSVEREIPWDILESLQGLASILKGRLWR